MKRRPDPAAEEAQRRRVYERLAEDAAARKVKDPDAVGATMLSVEECRALGIPVDVRQKGRPPISPHLKEDLADFVHAYTPWARYALRCKRALCDVRGSDPNPNLWCVFALTYFSGEECGYLLPLRPAPPRRDGVPYEYRVQAALWRPPNPAPASPDRLSKQRRLAVATLLHRAGKRPDEAIKQARQLCAEIRRVTLPALPTRSFATKDGVPTSPVWFLRVLTSIESTLPALDLRTPGTITRRIGERFFSPVAAGRKKKRLPPPTHPA